ncbi:hypothetical protein [Chishuiella sp.]|uniref:hypothetical protein n=1 Tax=Chishuiella sp. TaxID=1969467 RepID=UPI0028AD5C17|nr:hypothetical protein [Chishuiella sp.]
MEKLIYFIITVGISIGIFFLLRNFFCWYYKINDIINLKKQNIELQEENNALLKELVSIIKREAQKD